VSTLAERLGFPADAKLLIINCDDLGSSHAANVGIYDALRDGIATSATLMVPAPWARHAAAQYRGEDVGVHLTLNAEYDLYRWGPITHAPSLLDGDGGFPRTLEDLWDHADLDEVRRELRAQVERAIYWGFDVSHLDNHMGVLQLRPEFFDVYLDLAVEFCLYLDPEGDRLPVPRPRRGRGRPVPRLLHLPADRLRRPQDARTAARRSASRSHRAVGARRHRHPGAPRARTRLGQSRRRPRRRRGRPRGPLTRPARRRRADRLPGAARPHARRDFASDLNTRDTDASAAFA
jgi:hypothetical protein